MKKVLVTYATEEYIGTSELLKDSIYEMVDECCVYKKSDIDLNFYNKNSKILNKSRGAGYWIWKPYFILKTMECLNWGDICLYLDSGIIVIRNIDILFDLCVKNDGILLFENRNANHLGQVWKNYMWTKYDCFKLMNCLDEQYIYGPQVDAAFQLYQKTNKSIEFLNEYLKYCESENIVTDIPNITGDNFEGFIDHRHDQSILSLLAIKNKIQLERCPSHWGTHLTDRKFKNLFYHHKKKINLKEIIATDYEKIK